MITFRTEGGAAIGSADQFGTIPDDENWLIGKHKVSILVYDETEDWWAVQADGTEEVTFT